jgi:signal transduction histidine kinase
LPVKRRAVLVDVAVAAVALGISVAVLGSEPVAADLREPDAVAYLLLAVYSGSAAVRRVVPLPAVVAGIVAGFAYAVLQYPVALTPVVLLPVYTAGSLLPARRARQVLVFAIAVSLAGTLASPGPTDPAVPTLVALAWLLGSYVGRQRAYTAELEHQNALLAQAQADLADRAVGEERLRLARELHDVVAHTMSVVAVHAGTGRMVAETDPVAAREALATIETSTRAALLEMRRLLGVLRGADGDGPGALAPAPGLLDLDALVAEVVRSGVEVDVRVEGERPEVPAGVDLSGYRIVQEALTNVLKHAGGAKATVVVRYANDSVTVEVDDEGAHGRPMALPSAGRHGLVGMRERVTMFGGDLHAGPRADGGFRISARLPFSERA